MSELLGDDGLDSEDMVDLAAGHDAALNRIMERYGEFVHRFALRSLGNPDDALDLVQETFVRVYKQRNRYRPERKFRSWLLTIASNLVRDRIRWRMRHPTSRIATLEDSTGSGGKEDPSSGSRQDEPDDTAIRSEEAAMVREAITGLTEDLRIPLVLFHYEGHSYSEIGEILECSSKAVEMRLYRAKKQLLTVLEPQLKKI